MVNLKDKPFYLNDEQIKCVEDTINSMSLDEKIGQLFINLGATRDENYLKGVVSKYHIGGARYRRSQSVAEIKANGIDGKSTPYVQYTINAKEAGTYTVYFSASYGIYQPTVEQMDATVAIEVNNKVSFHTVS